MIFPQSFRQLSQFAYNFYVLSKMGPKWQPRRWRHTCIRRAKLSMTRTHSSYGISLIFAVISAFSSPIVWGLFSFTLSLRYHHRWKSGGFKSGECAMRQYWWSFGHHWDGAEAYNSGSGKMGATPHKTNDSLAWLRERFKDRLISTKCEIECAAHSPDLNPPYRIDYILL
jgi:hypothetical protein